MWKIVGVLLCSFMSASHALEPKYSFFESKMIPISGVQPTYKALAENELKYIVTLGTYIHGTFHRIGIGYLISARKGVMATKAGTPEHIQNITDTTHQEYDILVRFSRTLTANLILELHAQEFTSLNYVDQDRNTRPTGITIFSLCGEFVISHLEIPRFETNIGDGEGFIVAWNFHVNALVKATVRVNRNTLTSTMFGIEFDTIGNYVLVKQDLGAIVFLNQCPVGIITNYKDEIALMIETCQEFAEIERLYQ